MYNFDKTFLKALGKALVPRYKCLEHVYHSPKTGKFIATDAHHLLMYQAFEPPLNSWYNRKGEPVTLKGEMPDIDDMVERTIKDCTKSVPLTDTHKCGEYLVCHNKLYSIKQIETIEEFMGSDDYDIKCSEGSVLMPLYYHTKDGLKEAFVMPLDISWVAKVGDAEFNDWNEAEAFATVMGLTIEIERK